VVVDALRRQSTPRARLGLGLVVLAGAQLYRVATTTPTTVGGGMGFAELRLVGLVVVLVGLAQLVMAAVRSLHRTQWQQQEELGIAARHMERAVEHAAERDHELRNGLAGLAGITHLLGSEADDIDHERLRQAVLAELGRLHRILDGEELATDGSYAVEPVLAGLVTLRGSVGAPIELQAESGLRARGDSALLSQIVTNLLANCDQHAPGAPVRVLAYADGDSAVVEVRDEGPGLPDVDPELLFERGVREGAAGGSGLGLHISRRLAEHDGGTLEITDVTAPPGCLARVRIPVP
jgi:two-component system OmpR family sensor kinase